MPGKCVRGTVLNINLDPTVGHEQAKTRPCVVIQNDVGNQYSPTTIVAVITGAENIKKAFPIHVPIPKGEGGLTKESVVLCSQIRTVDEIRFGKILGQLNPSIMKRIDAALRISLQL
ncbi:MAG TPA: type II toxin-antitoxin system PemK/MazF family toxin [Bryobacteraceae bacterium]|nr:type II toxin-antitoxin system PemK/MazF family toxin [Bryobacteraceae bacterium]